MKENSNVGDDQEVVAPKLVGSQDEGGGERALLKGCWEEEGGKGCWEEDEEEEEESRIASRKRFSRSITEALRVWRDEDEDGSGEEEDQLMLFEAQDVVVGGDGGRRGGVEFERRRLGRIMRR